MSDLEKTKNPSIEGIRLPELVIERAVTALIGLQNHDGHWVGELEGDTILSSEYILCVYFMGWEVRDAEEIKKCLNFLRRQQNDEGGFSLYPGGPSDVSASVKAYFVLKLFGEDPDSPPMVKARKKILRLGGIDACNTFTKITLALFGQVSWRECPAVPPELILFPRWFPFNIYEMSSWSRTIVIPISIIWAGKPLRQVPPHAAISELRIPLELAPEYQPLQVEGASKTWQLVFTSIDKAAKLAESFNGKLKIRPLRKLAIKRALEWIQDRFEDSDGLGGILPPTTNSLIAFRFLGVPDDDPHFQMAERALKGLLVHGDDDEIRIQPCHSPVWDTAIAVNSLVLAGEGYQQREGCVQRAAEWLLDREVKNHGDWSKKVRDIEPAGWYFEYANEHYPDVDDTIMVMMALKRANVPEAKPALGRAMKWVRAMQSRDGGWAAFDRDNNRQMLTNVPFADHNAMLDPPTSDITARTLEMMGLFGIGLDDPQVPAAIKFIRKDQEPEGCWYGRWGVNYIYGTWQVLRGLFEIGCNMDQPWIQRGADWLESIQNPDGGFGESIASYDDPSLKGIGPSTPSQTAWVLMGLVATGRQDGESAKRGIDYLCETQLADGTWEEEFWTGTGFPKVFYLRYYLYRLYFPIAAIAMWRDAVMVDSSDRGSQTPKEATI
ncbi:MAG: squalene-hopene/tetraprenyl-beta-curcumene cyclase [Planctomycetota bacterium]|jgi:squalene-hopene/tetraprenyl-beta-curcumene cyclase